MHSFPWLADASRQSTLGQGAGEDFRCSTRVGSGAPEVTVGKEGAELTRGKIHHNYSYSSCGFFEVSSLFSPDPSKPVRGKFTNSSFYNNVAIDNGWLHLLQVASTDVHNIRWENHTVVQHKGSLNEGIVPAGTFFFDSANRGGILVLWPTDGTRRGSG